MAEYITSATETDEDGEFDTDQYDEYGNTVLEGYTRFVTKWIDDMGYDVFHYSRAVPYGETVEIHPNINNAVYIINDEVVFTATASPLLPHTVSTTIEVKTNQMPVETKEELTSYDNIE